MNTAHPDGMIYVTVMNRIRKHENLRGFALPTVMIASVVMMMVLLSGLVASSSVNSALRSQYNAKVLQLAGDAGVNMVNACLAKSYYVVTWTDVKPLKPNTDCNGDAIAGASQYVLDTPNLKSSFSVPAVVLEGTVQRANVTAQLNVFRASSNGAGTPQRVDTQSRSALIGSQNSFSTVAFGYYSGDGAQIAVVLANGEVKTLGTNTNGRLGNGTTTNSLTPTNFNLPANKRGAAAFTNFLSLGLNVYVLTQDGEIYGAGGNGSGQLGNGVVTGAPGYLTNPAKFNLPVGVKGRFVAALQNSTFVIGDNGSVYAAGACAYGQLGINNGACTNVSTPTRVALPAVTADTNTQPVPDGGWVQPTNLVADRLNMYIRMIGGAVYGWGYNDVGQLGTGNNTQANAPVRLQALSSTAAPYLDTGSTGQLSFNGTNLYVLDKNGQVWTSGSNVYGQLLGMGVLLRNVGTNTMCIRKDPGSANLLTAASTCNSADGWQFLEYWPDKTWRFRTNSGTFLPTDSMLCATAPGALGGTITMLACTGAVNQQWDFQNDFRIRSLSLTTGCAEPGFSTLILQTCSTSAAQQWDPDGSTYFRTVPPPPYDATLGRYPKYVKVSTDNGAVLLLDENGNVWAAGGNNRGQMGTNSPRSTFEPLLKKVIIPAGRKVIDIYITETDPSVMTNGFGYASYSNSYFVLDDGSVYGAGANNHGQLGNGVALPGPDAELTPIKMNLPPGVQARSVQSAFGTTVVLTTTGKVYTVGNNANGQLGDGTTTSSSTPKANQYTNQRSTISY